EFGNVCRKLGWLSSPRSVYIFSLETFRRLHGVDITDYAVLLKTIEDIYSTLSAKSSPSPLVDDADILFKPLTSGAADYVKLGGLVLDLADRTFESAEYVEAKFYLDWITRLLESSISETSEFRIEALLRLALFTFYIKTKQSSSGIWGSELEYS